MTFINVLDNDSLWYKKREKQRKIWHNFLENTRISKNKQYACFENLDLDRVIEVLFKYVFIYNCNKYLEYYLGTKLKRTFFSSAIFL